MIPLYVYDSESSDETAYLHRLVSAFDVRISEKHSLNMHAQLSSGAGCLNFGLHSSMFLLCEYE